MKKNVVVVYSTNKSEYDDTIYQYHIKKTIGCKHTIKRYWNFGEYSLTEIYNKALNDVKDPNSIVVFIHDDLVFRTRNWGLLLLSHFNNNPDYDIIGIAGSTYMPASGRWWDDRTKMMGIVEHTDGYKEWVSTYSPEFKGIKPVVLVDGLFMACNPDTIENNFDEEFKGFHLYDLSWVIPNYLDGCNIGVITNIRVLHKSMGVTNDEWEKNRQQFVEKYKDELPIKLDKPKLSVLITCQFFNGYTGSEMSVFELAKGLKNQGCDVTILSSVIGDPLVSEIKKFNIDVYNLQQPPNYVLTEKGYQFKYNEREFDIIHINHKPVGEQALALYNDIPAVMHVRSEVIPVFEVPIIHPNIKKYISIRESITEYIKSFGINEDKIVLIDNPFDTSRFNTEYKEINNERKIALFVGSIDYLRIKMLYNVIEHVKNNNHVLWIIGRDSNNFLSNLIGDDVIYLGEKKDVENYYKKCDYTVGIYKGRSTIEGFLCGKPGWIYEVDKEGKILNKEFVDVPDDIYKYSAEYSSKKIIELYKEFVNE